MNFQPVSPSSLHRSSLLPHMLGCRRRRQLQQRQRQAITLCLLKEGVSRKQGRYGEYIRTGVGPKSQPQNVLAVVVLVLHRAQSCAPLKSQYHEKSLRRQTSIHAQGASISAAFGMSLLCVCGSCQCSSVLLALHPHHFYCSMFSCIQ